MFRPGRKEKLQAEHFGSLRSCPQSSSDAEIHHSIKSEIGTTATTATLEPLKSDRNGLMKPPNGYIPVPVKDDGPLLQDLFFPPRRPTGAKVSPSGSQLQLRHNQFADGHNVIELDSYSQPGTDLMYTNTTSFHLLLQLLLCYYTFYSA